MGLWYNRRTVAGFTIRHARFAIRCFPRRWYAQKQGIYRDGKIELTECPEDVRDETRVIVTFLEKSNTDLRACGIDAAQAETIREQLGSFAEEWDSLDMEPYDNYDAGKAEL